MMEAESPGAPLDGIDLPPEDPFATVGEWMHVGLVSCPPATQLPQIVDLMRVHGIHAVAVREGALGEARNAGAAAQPVLGLVDDLACLGALEARRPEATAAELAEPFLTISVDAPLSEAAALLRSQRQRRALVLGPLGGAPLGVLAVSDLLRYLAQ